MPPRGVSCPLSVYIFQGCVKGATRANRLAGLEYDDEDAQGDEGEDDGEDDKEDDARRCEEELCCPPGRVVHGVRDCEDVAVWDDALPVAVHPVLGRCAVKDCLYVV